MKVQTVVFRRGITFILVLAVVLAAHGVGIFNGYTWDDRYLIPKAEKISFSGKISDIFMDREAGSSGIGGSYYRPLRTILFVIVTFLPGPHTVYLHALSIFLHACVSFMIFQVISLISKQKLFPLLVALIFAVHPATTESVAGISNVKEILATLFTLISLYCIFMISTSDKQHARYSYILSLSTILGLFSKETALVIPLVAVAALVIYRQNARRMLIYCVSPVIAITVMYLLMIFYVSPGQEGGEYILGSPLISIYTTASAFIKYFEIIFWPVRLSIRHDIEWITSPFHPHVAAVAIFMFGLMLFASIFIRKEDYRAMPLMFFVITLFPIANVIPIIGHVMSERYIYMPLAALCILLGVFLGGDKLKRLILPVVCILIIALSSLSLMRTLEWKNDRTLFESAVKIAPNSLVVRWNLYRIYLEDGEYQKANDEYNEMVRINMSVTKKYAGFAVKKETEGDFKGAEKIWNKAEYSASGNSELLEYVRTLRHRKKF